MKKTAVEWLVEQMFGEHTRAFQKQIDQAKAMEKEQIEDAYLAGEAKDRKYYNETYNGPEDEDDEEDIIRSF